MNDEFEEELHAAMRAVRAPAGFADSVMQRVAAEDAARTRVLPWPARRRGWIAGALAACLLAGAGAGLDMDRVRRHRQQEAEQQFSMAMTATNRALAQTREQLQRAGLRFAD